MFLVLARARACYFWTEPGGFGRLFSSVANMQESKKLSWPWWAPWTLLAVGATSLLTIAATLYDIL
jgi:hypothetical protein